MVIKQNLSDQLERYKRALQQIQQQINDERIKEDSELIINNIYYPFNIQIKVGQDIIQFEQHRESEFLIQLFSHFSIKTHLIDILQIINAIFKEQYTNIDPDIKKISYKFIYDNLANIYIDSQLFILLVKIGQCIQFSYTQTDQELIQNLVYKYVSNITINQFSIIKYINSTISQLLFLFQTRLENDGNINQSTIFIFNVLEQFIMQLFNVFSLNDIFMLASVQNDQQKKAGFTFNDQINQIVQYIQTNLQKSSKSFELCNKLSFQLQLITLIFIPTYNIIKDSEKQNLECLSQIQQALGRYICGNTIDDIKNSININNIIYESWSDQLQQKQQSQYQKLQSHQRENQQTNKSDQPYIWINMQLFLQLKQVVIYIINNKQEKDMTLNKFFLLIYMRKETIKQTLVQEKADSQDNYLNLGEDSFMEQQSAFQRIIAKLLSEYPIYYDIFGEHILFIFNLLTSLIDIKNSQYTEILCELLKRINNNYSLFDKQQVLMDVGRIQKTQQNIIDQTRVPIYLKQLQHQIISQLQTQLQNISKNGYMSQDSVKLDDCPSQSRFESNEHKDINYNAIFDILKCISTEENKDQICNVEWQLLCDIFEHGSNEIQLKQRNKIAQYLKDPRIHAFKLLSKQKINLVNIEPGDFTGLTLYFSQRSLFVQNSLKLIRFDVNGAYKTITTLIQRNLINDDSFQGINQSNTTVQSICNTPGSQQPSMYYRNSIISVITPVIDISNNKSIFETNQLIELPNGVSIQRYRGILASVWIYGLFLDRTFKQLEQYLTYNRVTSPQSVDSLDHNEGQNDHNNHLITSYQSDSAADEQIIQYILNSADSVKQGHQLRHYYLFGISMPENALTTLKNIFYYLITSTTLIIRAYMQAQLLTEPTKNQNLVGSALVSSLSGIQQQMISNTKNKNMKDVWILEQYAVAAIQNIYTLFNIVVEWSDEMCCSYAQLLRWYIRQWTELKCIPNKYNLSQYLNQEQQTGRINTVKTYRKQLFDVWNSKKQIGEHTNGLIELFLMHYTNDQFIAELNSQVSKIRASQYQNPKNLYKTQQNSSQNQHNGSQIQTTPSHRQMMQMLQASSRGTSPIRQSSKRTTNSAQNAVDNSTKEKGVLSDYEAMQTGENKNNHTILENGEKTTNDVKMMIAMLFFTEYGSALMFYDTIMQYVEYSDILLFILIHHAITLKIDSLFISIAKIVIGHIAAQFKQQDNKYLKIKVNYRMLFTNQLYKLFVEIIKIQLEKCVNIDQNNIAEIQQLIVKTEKFQLQHYEKHFVQYIILNIQNIFRQNEEDSSVQALCQRLGELTQAIDQKIQPSQIRSTFIEQYINYENIMQQTQHHISYNNQSQTNKIYHKLTVLTHNQLIYQGSFQNFQYDIQEYLNNQIELSQVYHKYFKNSGKPLFIYDMKALPQVNDISHINQQRKFIDMLIVYFTVLEFQFRNVIDNIPMRQGHENTSPYVFHLNEYLLEFKWLFETIPTSESLYYNISIILLTFYTLILKQIMSHGYQKDICYNFSRSVLPDGLIKQFIHHLSVDKQAIRISYIYVQQLYHQILITNLLKVNKAELHQQIQNQQSGNVYIDNLVNIYNNGIKQQINIGYKFKQLNPEQSEMYKIISVEDTVKTPQKISFQQIFSDNMNGFTIYKSSPSEKIDLTKYPIHIQLSLLPLYLQNVLIDYKQLVKIQFMVDSYFLFNDKVGYLAEREQLIASDNLSNIKQQFNNVIELTPPSRHSSNINNSTQQGSQTHGMELTCKNNYCVILYILKKLKQYQLTYQNSNNIVNYADVISRLKLKEDTLYIYGLLMELFNDNTLIDYVNSFIDNNYYYYFIAKHYKLFIQLDQIFIMLSPFIKQHKYLQILEENIYENVF